MDSASNASIDVGERFVTVDCAGEQCVAIYSAANALPVSSVGVVIVVGGPQYRVGSHRQFVLLARDLARSGIHVLRFDYRGMGDSDGPMRTFESIDDDIAAAVATLRRESGVSQVVLWGLCDAASAALIYAATDPRVVGVIAVNPWARAPETEASARLRHYYLDRIGSADFWRKLIAGGIHFRRRGSELLQTIRAVPGPSTTTPYLRRMHDSWRTFQGSVLFVLSGNDYTAREFEAWIAADADRRRMFRSSRVRVERFEPADHTFSKRAWLDALANASVAWIRERSAADVS